MLGEGDLGFRGGGAVEGALQWGTLGSLQWGGGLVAAVGTSWGGGGGLVRGVGMDPWCWGGTGGPGCLGVPGDWPCGGGVGGTDTDWGTHTGLSLFLEGHPAPV